MHLSKQTVENEPDADYGDCPDCGEPLKPKKSWGGLPACYCLWGGRKPSVNQIERLFDQQGVHDGSRSKPLTKISQ